ncbi:MULTISPECIES: hypothetical protein [unclassified Oceanobacillus]|uniref:hypothetical protein n=1 Tax=unclassified Oceanobacillus TaxID=2630292 RepID=UPI001BE83284|nr:MULTISPECIES: hypothetical protein [unclassified Oceanobacillus]MBT2600928.1 hypothetical protein [Oceanobacillus sp. ISL-74]MBT2653621.1 hypothetical protein [Oceanobacillus sp. ISL-73]
MAKNKKKKARVNNTHTTRKSVSNSKSPLYNTNNLTFDFSYSNWIRGIRTKDFCNKLSGPDEFSKQIFKCLYELIPYVQKNWDRIKRNPQSKEFPHCHLMAKSKESLVKEVIQKTHTDEDIDLDNDYKIWQIGLNQGLRAYAIYNHNSNTLFPVFIDYFHQIHASEKHNHKQDLSSKSFCPIDHYL